MLKRLYTLALLLCCTLSSFFGVAQVVPSFSFSPSSGCAPQVVHFSNTTTGTYSSSSWNFGNGAATSSLTNPSTTYISPGTYTITLTVSGSFGAKSVSKSLTIYPAPTVSLAFTPNVGCDPLPVSFSPTVTPGVAGSVTYYWDFGDGMNSSASAPGHTYAANTATVSNYTPKVTVTNSKGCATTFVSPNSITVNARPKGSFSASTVNNCNIPANVSFSSTVTGNGPFTLGWTFGDLSTGTGASPSHSYTASGAYDVALFMTDAKGCRDSVKKANYIHVRANNARITGPSSGCDSSTVSFSNPTPGNSGSTWDFGDGTGTTSGSPVNHVYTAPGLYSVTLVSNDSGCADTVRQMITIHPKPVAWISYDTPCHAPATVTFTGHSTIPSTTYSWSFQSGGTASGNPVTHYYPSSLIDSARIIATAPTGCTDTFQNNDIMVYDYLMQSRASAIGGCVPLTTKLFTSLVTSIPYRYRSLIPWGAYPYKTVAWHWVFDGDTTWTSSDSTPVVTFTTVGMHHATVTLTTSNGCQFTDVLQIAVGDTIPPSFSGGPYTVCPRQEIKFQNTTADTSIAFYWFYSNNDESGFVNGDYKFRRPGTYYALLISDFNGCRDSILKLNMITVLPSDANFDDSLFCWPSLTTQMTDISIGATTHLWTFGDGSPSSTQPHPQHTFPGPGKYAVTQMTWSATYGCRDTVTDTVEIIPTLVDFIIADSTLCLGETLHLTAIYSGTRNHEWRWGIDNYVDLNDRVNLPTKDSLFTITGLHKAALYVKTYGRCYDSVVKDSIVDAHPIAGFTASPIIGCTPLSVSFKDTTHYTIATQRGNVYWDFGNGDTSRVLTQNTSELYPTAGQFSIKQVVTDWIGCKDSVLLTNYIEARKPSAFFQVKKTAGCIGELFNFSNLSVGATRNLATYWSFGDGDSATSFHAKHAYAAAGTYVVKMTVMDSTGCSDTMQTTINITQPKAAFTLSDSLAICPPLIVNFNSKSTGAGSYFWDFKNTGTASITNPSSTFSTPGIYPVTLVVTDGNGCTDTARNVVRVLGYAGAFSYPNSLGCVPLTVNFAAKISGIDSMIWDFADGNTQIANELTTSHTYLSPGAFVPKLIFIDKLKPSCRVSSVGLDTIKVDAVFAGFEAINPCEKSVVQLKDTSRSLFSPSIDWRWDFGSSGNAIGNPISKTFGAAGVYPVKLKVTNTTGCKDSITQDITIFPLPSVVAMDDTALCVPDGITLIANGAQSYSWTPISTLSCANCSYPIASPTSPTTYRVTGIDSNGCKNVDTLRVAIQTKATFVVNKNYALCLGEAIRLYAAGATLYAWTPAEGLDSPNIAQPLARPNSTTTYTITAKEGSCAPDAQKVVVTVHPLPSVDAGSNAKIVAGKSTLLQVSGFGISRVQWKADATLSCLDCFAPEASPKLTTTYHVTAFNEFGCSSMDSVTVVVLCDGSQLFVPNTFSPNGDGNNDVFFPRGEGIQLIRSFRIYNRWGELMFARENVPVNDASSGWDGLHNGKILPPDVFVYILEANCSSGAPIMFKGDITLLK